MTKFRITKCYRFCIKRKYHVVFFSCHKHRYIFSGVVCLFVCYRRRSNARCIEHCEKCKNGEFRQQFDDRDSLRATTLSTIDRFERMPGWIVCFPHSTWIINPFGNLSYMRLGTLAFVILIHLHNQKYKWSNKFLVFSVHTHILYMYIILDTLN